MLHQTGIWLSENWWAGIGGLAALVSVAIALIPRGRKTRSAVLEIVSVDLDYTEKGLRWDIKIRNPSSEVAFISEIIINIRDCIFFVDRYVRTYPVPVTAEYDVLLPLRRGIVRVSLSQAVKPNDVDRFAINLAVDAEVTTGMTLMVIDFEIIYNANRSRISGRPLVYSVPNARRPLAYVKLEKDDISLEKRHRTRKEVEAVINFIERYRHLEMCPRAEGLIEVLRSYCV
jgi:hypothetical protein